MDRVIADKPAFDNPPLVEPVVASRKSAASIPDKPAVAILGATGAGRAFGESLARSLAERGWAVSLYRPAGAPEGDAGEARVVPVRAPGGGALSRLLFAIGSARRAAGGGGVPLILDASAPAAALCRLRGRPALVRSAVPRGLARRLAGHLIVDDPEEARRLGPERASVVAHGCEATAAAPVAGLAALGLAPRCYALAVGPIGPDGFTLPIVRAWGDAMPGIPLVAAGSLSERNADHRAIRAASGPEVVFVGAAADPGLLAALRFHARLHIHGEARSGVSPDLVEALGAGAPILARDTPANRWAAGPVAAYFSDEDELRLQIVRLLHASEARLDAMSEASRARHAADFHWAALVDGYERALRARLGATAAPAHR